MKNQIKLAAALLLLTTLSLQLATAFAQSTAFTYQGRLNSGGNPTQGIYDLRFTIYDAALVGNVGGGPLTAAAAAVSNGLFTVTLDFGSVFDGNARWLEIAVRTNGGGAFTLLDPRQLLTPAPYAITAANLSGALSASQIIGTISPNNIASASITADKLAPAVTQAGAVPPGSVVLSRDVSNGLFMAAGYVKIGKVTLASESWNGLDRGDAALPGPCPQAVWTGSEVVLVGLYFDGGASPYSYSWSIASFNPSVGTWSKIPPPPGLPGRRSYTVVWTGNEVIIWGGGSGTTYLGDGARWNTTTRTWHSVTAAGAPSARFDHTAVWAGTKMLVWGGTEAGPNDVATGGAYDPATDSWTALSTTGAPAPRCKHTAVWTGSQMLVWGGLAGGNNTMFTGGAYAPDTDTWTEMNPALPNRPWLRINHRAVWTGSKMVIWGGQNFTNGATEVNDGGIYDPSGGGSWVATSLTGAVPSRRANHCMVWTGSRVLVWGGYDSHTFDLRGDGAQFDPVTNAWLALTSVGAPTPREKAAAVWTGSEMFVYGGVDYYFENDFKDGGRYSTNGNSWTSITPTGFYANRYNFSAGWTGKEMIAFGGTAYLSSAGPAGRYDPVINGWRPLPTTNSPSGGVGVWSGTDWFVWNGPSGSARWNAASNAWFQIPSNGAPALISGQVVLGTGSKLIVWGGRTGTPGAPVYHNTGAIYDPTNNTWTPTTVSGAPAGRVGAAAVWSGTDMIVWGGFGAPGFTYLSDGARYAPATDSWTTISAVNAPTARVGPNAVWSGRELLVWGGNVASGGRNDTGGRYDPATDTWRTITTNGVPSGRGLVGNTWTGSQWLIWGGEGVTDRADGALYNPREDSWTAVTTAGAPAKRSGHQIIWADEKAILCGGIDSTSTAMLNDVWSYTPANNMWLYQKQ